MKIENAADQPIDVRIVLNIAKVDKASRTIEGIATQEVTDVHGEIVDHESMKAVLADWPGNIREMHQPKAVGKAIKVIADDERKATILRSRISKGAPDTWEKVLDGTLCMYSIGGQGKRVTTKNASGEDEQRLLMTALHEVSLVDNGACPTAKFEIVKAVDGAAAALDYVEAQADESDPDPDEPDPLTAALTRFPAGKAREVLTAAIAKVAALPVEKRNYPTPYTIDQVLCAISCLERIVADEWWKAESADGSDTDRAQLVVLKNAIELVISYLLSEFAAQFENEDAGVALARRVALADAVIKSMPVLWSHLDGTGQLWIAKRGARHSKADTAMIQNMHDTALSLGAACQKQDCEQCKAAAAKAAESSAATPAEPVATEPAAPTQETAPAPAQDANVEAATGQPGNQPAAPAAPVQASAAPSGAEVLQIVKTAVAEAVATHKAESDRTIAAHKAESDRTIAELRTQVEKLSNEPVPGGPKTRATTEATPVHKSLGNGATADLAGMDPQVVEAFAAQLAREAKTEDEKLRIATNLLKFQHSTGAGAVAIQQTTGRPRSIDPYAGTDGQ